MNRERLDASVHFVVVVLNMLSISAFLIFWLSGGFYNSELGPILAISVFSWLALLMLTIILVLASHRYRRLALGGMLCTFALYLVTSLVF